LPTRFDETIGVGGVQMSSFREMLLHYRALVNAFGKAKRVQAFVQQIDRTLSELETLSHKRAQITQPLRHLIGED
jgi:hypothetical protein